MKARRARAAAEARRKRWGQIGIGLLLVFLMVFSILGYSVNTRPTAASYGNADFEATDLGFVTEVDSRELLVHAVPIEETPQGWLLQTAFQGNVFVDMEEGVIPLLQDAQYIATTFDPEVAQPDIQFLELARFNFQQNIPGVYGGVLTPSEKYPQAQHVTCESAEQTYPVVRFIRTNASNANITRDANCVTVEGSAQAVLAGKDLLVLGYYGVV